MDNLINFASSILATGIDAIQLTASVNGGEGYRFPSSDFNVIIWDGAFDDMTVARYSNALAIYRVLSRTGDVLLLKPIFLDTEKRRRYRPRSRTIRLARFIM